MDARLGARLYDKSPVCIQDILVDDTKRQHKGQESFMIMIKSIATRINFRCEARTVQLLNKYITKGESCTDPTKLLSMVQGFRMTHGVYSRMCDLGCKALYKTAIEHMLSALSKQTEMNAPLNIRMGISAVMNKDNFEKYMEDLEEVALDLTLYEGPPAAKATRKPYTNPRHVNAVDKADQLCMNKREGKPCRMGPKCVFKHDGFSNQICTDKDYLDTGICSKFNDGCVHKHPWNETKLGPKEDAMQKLGHMKSSQAKRAYLHSVNMVEEAVDISAICMNTTESAAWSDSAVACVSCKEFECNMCPDGLCVGCCEMNGYECIEPPIAVATTSESESTDSEPEGVGTTGYEGYKVVHGHNHDVELSAAATILQEYKQKLRKEPAPKIMHAVDRDAIMAVLEGDCDGWESDSDCDDDSVTSSSSDELMGHEAVCEEQSAMAVESDPGTWNADDGTYEGSTDPDTEEIVDDGEITGAVVDGEDYGLREAEELITSITAQLTEQGWKEEQIDAWMLADCDMLKAMQKMRAGVMAAYEPETDDNNAPDIRIMFDGGTFAHMWGTDLMNSGCVINLRKVPRVPCRTAKGIMWLDTKGDAVFNGMILKGGFVNPNNSTSLISEGMLMLFENWDFHKNSSIGFTFTWPGLDKPKVAWRQGVLYYVPADMIPKHECSAVYTVEKPTLSNDIDQADITYNNDGDMDTDEDFYEEPTSENRCDQDTWMRLTAQEAFAAFTVSSYPDERHEDMVMMLDHCCVCEDVSQDFRRGLERPC